MKDIFLLRHTAVAAGLGMCYGATDVPLADSFNDDVKKILTHFKHFNGPIITSDLSRCTALAERIHSHNQLDPACLHRTPALRELNFGDWEMTPWADIAKGDIDRWSRNLAEHAPPNGESFAHLQQRAVDCISPWLDDEANAMLVVCHGGTIRALIAHFLSLPLQQAVQFNVVHGSHVHITQGGRSEDQPGFFQLQL